MDWAVPVRMREWLMRSVVNMPKWLLDTARVAAASTLAGAAAAAVAPVWERQQVKYSFPYDPTPTGAEDPLHGSQYQRTTLYFTSQGERCEAWLYLPEPPPPTPPPTATPSTPATAPDMSAPAEAPTAAKPTRPSAATTTSTPASHAPEANTPTPAPTHPPPSTMATHPVPSEAPPAAAPPTTPIPSPVAPVTPTTPPQPPHPPTGPSHQDSTHPATVAYLPSDPNALQRGPSAPEPLPEAQGAQPRVAGTALPPVVLMAHGLGAQKDMGLHRYAHQFAEAGFAVLVFDYRGFGGSGGQERHVGTPRRYLEDWEAAVQFLTTELSSRVDTSRVTLWGTSYSGGHVLVLAARHATRVRCVISQEPFLSARAIALPNIRRRGPLKVLRALLVALHDTVRGAAGLAPAYIKAVGQQHELALLEVTDEEYQTFIASPSPAPNPNPGSSPNPDHSPDPNPTPPVRQGGWSNLMAARSGLAVLRYNPVDWLPKVRCPVMFVAGSRDYLCPPELIEGAFRRAPGGSELVVKSANHFELFRGMYVEADVIPEMVRFAAQHSAA